MADEEVEEVDGIKANGVNAFTSPRLGIAIVVKPVLTDGDFTRWITGVDLSGTEPIALTRAKMFGNAIAANILVHCTDKVTRETAKALDAHRPQWYGAQLMKVYYQYAIIDPN